MIYIGYYSGHMAKGCIHPTSPWPHNSSLVYKLLYILTGKQKLLRLCLIVVSLTTSLRTPQKLIGTIASPTTLNTWRTTKRKMAMIMTVCSPLGVTKVIVLMMTTNQSKDMFVYYIHREHYNVIN